MECMMLTRVVGTQRVFSRLATVVAKAVLTQGGCSADMPRSSILYNQEGHLSLCHFLLWVLLKVPIPRRGDESLG